jgi:hypothetical protein
MPYWYLDGDLSLLHGLIIFSSILFSSYKHLDPFKVSYFVVYLNLKPQVPLSYVTFNFAFDNVFLLAIGTNDQLQKLPNKTICPNNFNSYLWDPWIHVITNVEDKYWGIAGALWWQIFLSICNNRTNASISKYFPPSIASHLCLLLL